jgi:hypothetical protein
MLSKRFTDSFEAVSLSDPAVACLPLERLREYVQTRQMKALEEPRANCPALDRAEATVFTCRPLIMELDALADGAGAINAWFVFASHVQAVTNCGEPLAFQAAQGRQVLADRCREFFAPEVIAEIAQVVREMPGKGAPDSLPFTSPDGDWARRVLLHQQRCALRAMSEERRTDA